jgi:hypothetical protein
LLLPAHVLADTSATLATAINIPKGPASIEGFGRAYEVSPASGLPSLEYPIAVPPGRAGHAPELALHYHAGAGAGVLGLGWSLDLPAIERSPRAGIPRPGEPAVWTLRHLGDGEELTETAPGVYRQRIEQGAPILVRTLPGGAMSAVTADGTGYLFGLTDEARLDVGRGTRSAWSCRRSPTSTATASTSLHPRGRERRAAARRDHLERRTRPRPLRLRGPPRRRHQPRARRPRRARPSPRRRPHRGRR